jgi:formamidopyrimidine-DNA glycosylase
VPELPEVETVVRDLRPHLEGQRITGVRVGRKRLRRRWSARWKRLVEGRRVERVGRRGKWIALSLNNNHYLVIHLGMTGQLRVVPAAEQLAPHTHLVFRLSRGEQELRFCDIRRFGSATVLSIEEWRTLTHDRLGPEPFDLPLRYWRDRLAASRRCLKAVLLDQRVVAGVGNIYADESLFEAGLHPARLGCEINPEEAARLRKAIVTVLRRAIQRRGSSIRNYVGGSGRKGAYQNEFRVYGRTGGLCPRCGTPITCVRLAGRATHFCPDCQKAPHAKAQRRKGGPDGC